MKHFYIDMSCLSKSWNYKEEYYANNLSQGVFLFGNVKNEIWPTHMSLTKGSENYVKFL